MIMPTESLAAGPTLAEIETLTKRYADARDVLAGYVSTLEEKLTAAKRAALPDIKRAVARAAEREAELRAAIAAAPHLFEKPKTQVFHTIKVGFRKGTGGIDWESDDDVVARIRKQFTKDESDLLIRTTEKPIAKALSELDVATLKKLGCTVEDTGDVVVIKATDSEVEKIVNALLKGAVETD